MSDRSEGAARPTTAQTLDDVVWEYAPEDELRVLLVPAGEFFEGIPWDAPEEA